MKPMSIYADQTYQKLRQSVEQQAGQRLPGERELASQLGIPRAALLPQKDGPIGIIAANDWLVVGLRAGLSSRLSASLPALHLISFDGLSITADAFLRIEALVAQLQTIASDAVAELHRLLGSASGRVVYYPFH
jgi:hypothetical protein